MPHSFANRPRLMNLAREAGDRDAQFRWETINAMLYLLGGAVFVAGSVLFYPALERYEDLGAWAFVGGSLLYLVVTVHDLAEAVRHRRIGGPSWRTGLDLTAAGVYVAGTVLFIAGSFLFLSWVGREHAGAWCFILGSFLFVIGACVNVLQIVGAVAMITLQLMNLTAISFVVGSVLFTVASVPYLWTVTDREAETLHAFLATQYLIGSALFLLGGLFNYTRAYLVVRTATAPGA